MVWYLILQGTITAPVKTPVWFLKVQINDE